MSDEAKRETMTVGEAAKRLGISLPMVRRRMKWGDIEGTWSSPSLSVRTDVNGNVLRGHRRIFVDSVEAYERRAREAATDVEEATREATEESSQDA